MQACGSSLTALAIRFAEELRTHFVDVLERLEELWMIARNNEAMYTQSLCGGSPTRAPYGGGGGGGGSQSMHYGYPGAGGGPGQPYYPHHPPAHHMFPGHPHLHHHSHPGSPRNQPPPLPSCPPPPTMSSTYMGRCPSLQSHLDGAHVRPDPFGQQTYVTMDGDPSGGATGDDKKKGGSVFGRFLRNIGFRRSNRKGTYKQHQASSSDTPVRTLTTLQELLDVDAKDGDLNAYEISMSDEDRVALMVLVKEGKISTQTALAVVQKFEEEKKKATGGGGASNDDGKENDTPSKKSFGKKKKGSKPPKSQSTFSADDPHGGSLDQHPVSPVGNPCEHQLCRQRRVHSLGQLDLQAQIQGQGQVMQGHGQAMPMSAQQQRELHLERIGLTRAISCTTACGPPGYQFNPAQSDPTKMSRFHSPGHHHYPQHPQLQHQNSLPLPQQHHHPHHHHHQHHNFNKVDALRERLTGKIPSAVPKTSSKTSLISSGSDQSMEVSGGHPGLTSPNAQHTATPMPLRSLDPLLAARLNDGSNSNNFINNSNSTVSMSSDNNSPATSRKKSVQDPRVKNHRSASCSTGDDGISSDDNENGSRKLQNQSLGGSKGKGKQVFESKRGFKSRDTKISRPPLLKQQSAPVGSMGLLGTKGPYLGQAKSLVDYNPGPHDGDFVPLKKGEIINIMNLAQSGVWWASVAGRQGKVRFEHVEVVIDQDKNAAGKGKDASTKSVSDLLHKIGLGHLTGLFMLNGYDDLDIFSELDDHDLTTLHITDPDQRSKLLSAARVLGDWNDKSGPEPAALISAMDSPSSRAGNSSCDSGCYAGSDGLRQSHPSTSSIKSPHGQNQSSTLVPLGSASSHNHGPCKSCGKPKQPSRKLSAPTVGTNPQFTSTMVPISPSQLAGLPYYPTGQYPTVGAHGNLPYNRGHRYGGYSPYVPGHYPGQANYPGGPHMSYNSGGGMYPYGGPHIQNFKPNQASMPVSRTLTDMSVTGESANSSSSATTPTQGGVNVAGPNNPNSSTGLALTAATKTGVKPSPSSTSSGPGDRASLTEEDKEIIAITYGKSTAQPSGRLTTPLQSSSSLSQPAYRPDQTSSGAAASSNITICTMCVPGTSPGYSSHYAPGVERIPMFENPSNSSSMSSLNYSCAQCAAAYASCPECFPPPHHYYYNTPANYYRHYYVNTGGPGNSTLSSNGSSNAGTVVNNSNNNLGGVGSVRSDSKSSKMSLSSTCTQTTCLSPDHDDAVGTPVGTGGVSTFTSGGMAGLSASHILESSTSSNHRPTGHYAPSGGFSHYGSASQQPLMLHPAYGSGVGRTTTPLNRATPINHQAPPTSVASPPTLALANPGSTGSVGLLHLQSNVQPAPSASPAPPQEHAPPPPEWIGQSDGSGEGPGMARLYTRGQSQTPEGSDKSGGGDGSSGSSSGPKLKSPTRSLMPLVSTKLSAERIDLTEPPYSTAIGHCGIPPLLVQRYSEELRQETDVIALVLEQLRERQLRSLGRPCIQNEQLSQSCRTACDLQISSVRDFLISIGLPMYFAPLIASTPSAVPVGPSSPAPGQAGTTGSSSSSSSNQPLTLQKLLAMSETELEQATGADARHLRRIMHALGWVRLKLGDSTGASAEQGEAPGDGGKQVAAGAKAKSGTVTDKV
ncbi:sam and sh3 domain-containing protein 3 [Plakobranchus ocellatus]|uniref:Sam and sh3 domain-containing protein 3 n=1 Tax=Plakobranchus ocellatus TaxID=259542 RepID=A0AAV4AJS6_9GAST|nr:sam and sh3 domain-containing protein 3 [Plakobranchus ocellatus]